METKYNQELNKRLKEWVAMNRTQVSWYILGFVIAHLLLYLVLSFGVGRGYANQYLTEILIGLIVVDLILLVTFYISIAYHKIAEEIYNDQEKKIQENTETIMSLKNELNTDPVEIPLDVYEWARFDDNSPNKTVCVVVRNLSGEDIRCYGALTFLVRANPDVSTDNLFGQATRNGSLVSWSGGGLNDDDEVLIKSGQERILNIAQGIDNHLVFKMQNLDFVQYQNGAYAFDLEIGGHVGTKKIANKKMCFNIEYEKKHKTYAGGDERPYSSSDSFDININSTSVIKDYHQYNNSSYRKLDIKKRNCENEKET